MTTTVLIGSSVPYAPTRTTEEFSVLCDSEDDESDRGGDVEPQVSYEETASDKEMVDATKSDGQARIFWLRCKYFTNIDVAPKCERHMD